MEKQLILFQVVSLKDRVLESPKGIWTGRLFRLPPAQWDVIPLSDSKAIETCPLKPGLDVESLMVKDQNRACLYLKILGRTKH